VNMVRHHYPSVELGVVVVGHTKQPLDKAVLDCVILEEWESLVAREREESGVVGVLESLGVSTGSCHQDMVSPCRVSCKSGAWRLPSACATAPTGLSAPAFSMRHGAHRTECACLQHAPRRPMD
jgi:hypothetical protein